MYTYQDFQKDYSDLPGAVQKAITRHRATDVYRTACVANLYDRQRNKTIMDFAQWLYTEDGRRAVDLEATNNKLCCNLFNRLNTQRVTYSLGNGVYFTNDATKGKLGADFDTRIKQAGYLAQIHGQSFLFWNLNHVHVFPVTQFVPLWDEETGALRAGVRFWQVDAEKPVIAVLYEEDGYTRLKGSRTGSSFTVTEEKRAYRITLRKADADCKAEIVGEENYSSLPIVPLYGSRLQQSTLVGLRAKIDAIDLVESGFCNDLSDVAEAVWLITNAGGMTDKDVTDFRRRMKYHHIANVNNADDVTITPYKSEIPTEARLKFLDDMRTGIYNDFGALDVHTVAAGATNDHIDAAYQPLDENADDFEYQLIECIQQLLRLQGIDDTPVFKRNRISNQRESTEMILSASAYLDTETILNKLPFLTPDEVAAIIERKEDEDIKRFAISAAVQPAADAAADDNAEPAAEDVAQEA